MNPTLEDKAAKITEALRVAGRRALWLGQRLGTPVYVWRDGQIVDIAPTSPEPTAEEMEYRGVREN